MGSELLTAEDVARQLRIKKYTVYEMIKRGELPSSRVGKQVRVSQADINGYLGARKTGPRLVPQDEGAFSETSPSPQMCGPQWQGLPDSPSSQAVILSGQDMCLELLLARITGEGMPALRSSMGCYNGLHALYHGKITMAASHLWDGETGAYNYPFIRRLLPGLAVGVLRLAGRMQGFYVKKGNPLNIKDWSDLARPDLRMVNRERGSGTRILLDQKLAQFRLEGSRIQGYDREQCSHLACASAVARGSADLGCGCERGLENIPGVEFVPLQPEWYDFVFRLADRDRSEVKTVISYAASREFRRDLEIIGAYDVSQTGRYEEF
jgi:putative molybdopterin biosynthesis protein